jgi:biopolymer transport protein ExbD
MDDKEFDYMNVIPLVDVMLVLLTIVLTTSTFIATGGIPVELPTASSGKQDTLRSQTIEIDKTGAIHLNGARVTLAGLCDCIRQLNRESPVLIRADRDIALQTFVDVLDVVKNNEFTRVSLQTEGKR